MEKEEIIKDIDTPDGYELDETKSTKFHFVFKNKKTIKHYEDIEEVNGFVIDENRGVCELVHSIPNTDCSSRCVALTKKVAKHMIASAQISQLMPYYGGEVTKEEWKCKSVQKWLIYYDWDIMKFETAFYMYNIQSGQLLIFHTEEQAKDFINNNLQLIKDYFMVD